MTNEKIKLYKDMGDAEVYILEGTDKAVKVEWNFATGSDVGVHNRYNSYAVAELGAIDEDGEFADEVEDYILFNPDWDEETDSDDAFDELEAWKEEAVKKLLLG